MAIETRKGKLYLYSRRKVGNRWHKEYVGPVSPAEADHIRNYVTSTEKMLQDARLDRQNAIAEASAVLSAGEEFDRLADDVFRAVMFLTGHHRHHRGEWRKQQGIEPMCTLQGIMDTYGLEEPRPGLIKPVSNNPAHQATLAKAAAGDRSVLPAVRELLNDPGWLSTFGSVSNMAACTLLSRAAGDDVLMQEAVARKLEEHIQELIATDPTPVPFPVRMAATRVSHCWLAVHILETLGERHMAGSAAALGVERHLAIAERRLAVALKSLATLRRLNRPVFKQVNVANGKMVVNNQQSDKR